MRHNLNSLSKIVTAALTLDNVLVDLAGGNVLVAREGDVKVALVVSEIEVDFAAVVEDVDFTVPLLC